MAVASREVGSKRGPATISNCYLRQRRERVDRSTDPCVTDAFSRGDILPVVLISILFGCVLSRPGDRARPVRDMIDGGSMLIFGPINVIMRFAAIGAFGAWRSPDRYGIDRFMSEARSLVNVIGNGVAMIVISRTEGELDLARVNAVLDGNGVEAENASSGLQKVDGHSLPVHNHI
jgi:hypothetical protein